MPVYECQLYEKAYGEYRPVVWDRGEYITKEIVAKNAGKARYSCWLDWHECNEDIKITDIRVRSLSKRVRPHPQPGYQTRLEAANAIIRVIASYGRRFLSENSDKLNPVENPFVSYFKFDRNHELWFVDRYSRKDVLVRHSEWRGFSDGGTLRGVVEHLAKYIVEDEPVNIGYFSPNRWDCWGYGDDMVKVRDGVKAILDSVGGA